MMQKWSCVSVGCVGGSGLHMIQGVHNSVKKCLVSSPDGRIFVGVFEYLLHKAVEVHPVQVLHLFAEFSVLFSEF